MECYEKESKVFFIEKGAEVLAHEIYLYSRYFKDSTETLEQLYKSTTDEIVITEQEKELLFEQTKQILLNKYSFKLISIDPVIVEDLKGGL